MIGPESVLQAQVCEVLELCGWEWRHVSATAPTRDGGWRPDAGARDLPDLMCWHADKPGVCMFELKTGARRLTDGQHSLLVAWRAAGVPCWVIREEDLADVPGMLRSAAAHCLAAGPFVPTG